MSTGGGIDIKLSGDEKDLLTAQAKVLKSQEEVIDKYKKMLREARNTSRKGRTELERFAAATTKINRTPAERYKQTIDKLQQALRAGHITQETYNRAVKRAKHEMRGAGDQQENTFGSAARRKVMLWATGIGAAVFSISRIAELLRKVNAESDRLAQKGRESEGGLGELAQLAENQAQFRRLVQQARETFRRGGTDTLGEAAQLVFSLESAGAAEERELFTQLGATKLVGQPAEFARAAATLVESIGGEETGTFRQIVSKAFGASKFSPSRADELLIAAARGGTSARALGMSDEELLAATAQLATARGTAAEGGTAVAALLKSLDKMGTFGGKGLEQSVAEISGMNLNAAELFELLGRQEAVQGFRVLEADPAKFREILAGVRQAQQQDVVGQKLRLAESEPMLLASQAQRQAAASLDLSGEALGSRRNLADALRQEILAGRRRSGKSEISNTLYELGLEAGQISGAISDERILRKALEGGGEAAAAAQRLLGPNAAAKIEQTLNNAASRLDSAAANLQRATDQAAESLTYRNRAGLSGTGALEGQ